MKADRVTLLDLGTGVTFGEGLAVQAERFDGLIEGVLPPCLILCQHSPVITLGKSAGSSGVLASEETLKKLRVDLYRTDRGGQATVHSPGQLVAYPILNLRGLGLSPKAYVARLEEWMMETASHFGVESFRVEGKPGVYTGRGKLGALGVAISRGFSRHGIAFNVSNDLSLFRLILPCGERDIEPVSLNTEGSEVTVEEAAGILVRKFAEVFGVEVEQSS